MYKIYIHHRKNFLRWTKGFCKLYLYSAINWLQSKSDVAALFLWMSKNA